MKPPVCKGTVMVSRPAVKGAVQRDNALSFTANLRRAASGDADPQRCMSSALIAALRDGRHRKSLDFNLARQSHRADRNLERYLQKINLYRQRLEEHEVCEGIRRAA